MQKIPEPPGDQGYNSRSKPQKLIIPKKHPSERSDREITVAGSVVYPSSVYVHSTGGLHLSLDEAKDLITLLQWRVAWIEQEGDPYIHDLSF